ncbi:MAG: diaminopimelate decarboxylase [Pseudomonadota bacterium]|nr:diaminopimelate decarboxylase [Pseudomonadota bacterium]
MNRPIESQLRQLPHLGRDGDRLTMDGVDLVELAEREGTALFVFSERRLRDNASRFLAAARAGHPRAVVCYASKACSNVHVLRILHSEGLAIEVNSGGEIYKAQVAGFLPAEMVFNGVAKSAEELAVAIDLDIKAINVDSVFELRRIGDVARARKRRAAVSLRLVPGVAGGATPGIQTGSESSKFGMNAAELEEALGVVEGAGAAIEVVGLHVHIGSQVAELEAYRQAVAFAAGQVRRLAARLGRPLAHVNLGGGYPIPYVHGQAGRNEIDHFGAPMAAAAMVQEVATRAAAEIGGATEILFEPGRAIVGDAAVLLSRVESEKRRGSERWLYLDAGYNLLLDTAAVRWHYHMVTANRMNEATSAAFRVMGPLCDSADCFFDVEGEHLLERLLQRLPQLDETAQEELRAEVVRLPATRALPEATGPGDLVALLDVGAYSLEEMFQYCGRARAAAVVIRADGSVGRLRRRDRPEDLTEAELEDAQPVNHRA